jgi:hypothetical protein
LKLPARRSRSFGNQPSYNVEGPLRWHRPCICVCLANLQLEETRVNRKNLCMHAWRHPLITCILILLVSFTPNPSPINISHASAYFIFVRTCTITCSPLLFSKRPYIWRLQKLSLWRTFQNQTFRRFIKVTKVRPYHSHDRRQWKFNIASNSAVRIFSTRPSAL